MPVSVLSSRPSRGEIWVDHDGRECLIVSADDWNRRGVSVVAALPLLRGYEDEPFVVFTSVAGEPRRIQIDLYGQPKDQLAAKIAVLSAAATTAVNNALRSALAAAPPTPPNALPAGARLMAERARRARAAAQLTTSGPGTGGTTPTPPAAGFPLAGHLRFADLSIPGEGAKPVVVVSSAAYAADLHYEFVIVCRKTSNPTVRDTYDVGLRSQTGKVVCSDIRTVPADALSTRTTSTAVTPAERSEIIAAVSSFLAL